MKARIDADWPGETCHIIAGGPSVRQADLTRLAGKRVIVVNSSLFAYPQADALVFADLRWFVQWREKVVAFNGEVITTCPNFRHGPFRQLVKVRPEKVGGLSLDRGELAVNYTTLQAAINIAVHKGCSRIVLHGADMKPGPDGALWHHEPHPQTWNDPDDAQRARQIEDLGLAVPVLASIGVEILVANPESALPFWTKAPFEDALTW